MKINRGTFFIVLAVTLIVAYLAFFGINIGDFRVPGVGDMRFGIDIRGGVDAVYEPVGYDGVPTANELEVARTIIETRLDNNNILDREVTVDTTRGDIVVRFPWKSDEVLFDPQRAIAELGETAKLTFRDQYGEVLVDGSHVVSSKPMRDEENGEYFISLTFDKEGARLFAEATKRLIGEPICIYMDDIEISVAIVEESIPGGEAMISRTGTLKETASLATRIATGALPFSMRARNYSSISPSLGAGALDVMVSAGVLAFIIICAGLLIYYRIPGLVGCVALILQVSGQLLALSIPQITLTLPGIAGVILSIGMGIDANVIIAERISEEIKDGKKPVSAITAGFRNAFSSVFDGNVTVLIASIILLILGSGSMLSFAYSLLTGVMLNFLAGVTASRLMLKSLCRYSALNRPGFYESFSKKVTLGG